jgi:hypothetical protein
MFKKKKIEEKIPEIKTSENNLNDETKEIASGIKNALERGESLEKAMQSFANANYNINNIMLAADYITKNASQQIKETQSINKTTQKPIQKEKNLTKETGKKILGMKKNVFIIVIIISIVFLVGALILGLNWNNFLSFFNK